MNPLRYALFLMMLTAAGVAPPPTIAAETLPAEIGQRIEFVGQRIECTGQRIECTGLTIDCTGHRIDCECMPAHVEAGPRPVSRGECSGCGDASAQLDEGGRPLPAVVRAAELRMFALYGPRGFSTFPEDEAGSWAAGETASGPGPFESQAEDPWLGFDKAQHLSFSFLWTLGTQYVAVNKGHLSESRALPLSIGTSAAVGLSKELYDLHAGPTNVFSYRDLVANGVGILLATGVILL